jgi:hypothetical protein
VAAFLAALPTAEGIARFATDGAVAGDFLLLPDYEVREMFVARIPQLV